jgi:hypothetical protein
METLWLVYLFVLIAYVVFFVVTMQTFHRKGQSALLGFLLSMFLPIIALIVALVMPYDQPVLDERIRKKERSDKQYRDRMGKWQEEYDARHPAQPALTPLSTLDESPSQTRAQTICASLLIACPLIAAFQPGETLTGILGIAALLALVGLLAALLFPPKSQP